MKVTTLKTRAFLPPKDDIRTLLKEAFLNCPPKENSVVVITSKVVAIGEGRCVKADEGISKEDLAKQEADYYADVVSIFGNKNILTVKNDLVISKAGIDESNANGYFVLWPENPFAAAKSIYDMIKQEYGVKRFGVVIVDSHGMPFRLGLLGVSIAYYGFKALRDYRGKKDIFGRGLKSSQANVVDSLAVAAVLEMGEGNEQTPIAIIEDIKDITFTDGQEAPQDEVSVPMEKDIFAPLFKHLDWKKKDGKIQ